VIDTKSTVAAARNLQFVMFAFAGISLLALACVLLTGLFDAVGFGEKLARFGGYEGVTLVLWQGWAVTATVCVHLCLWMILFRTAGMVFRQIAQEAPAFASQSARLMSRLLWGLLIWGLLSQILASLAVTWHFPEGQRSIGIGFGTPQLTVAFAALIASFMARGFALGVELWLDHKEML
jgi:hypothetical protein